MRPIDILRISLSTFIHNKMRTILTVAGVAIGIGAIVFLLSLGYGLQRITIDEISSIKALATFNVTSGNSAILALDDTTVEKFKNISGVTSVNPDLVMSGQVLFDKSKTDIIINAVSAEYADLDSPRIEAGELYKEDNSGKIVLTEIVATAFGVKPADLVGKKVSLGAYLPNPSNEKQPTLIQKEYEVSGIIKESVSSYAYVPIGSIAVPANSKYASIKVKIADTKSMMGVKDELTKMGYKANSLGEKINQMNQVFSIIQIVLLILGAIALSVASIGMFNTLTISLLERTKDIGIMKSLGATDGEIYSIFLAESTLIATFGGVSGVAGALILGNIINVIVSTIAVRSGGDAVAIFQTPPVFILIVIGFSILVGVLTGVYPARRAAKLNPLDALRYE